MKKLAAILILLTFAVSAAGETLAEFRDRISEIRVDISELIGLAYEGETDIADLREFQDSIKNDLLRPQSRTIEFDGNSIVFDTRWIESKFKIIEDNPSQQIDVLTEIVERLETIEVKIAELQSAPQGTRSKDEDKRKLDEILSRPEFRRPEKPTDSWIDRILKWIDEWFREKAPDSEVPKLETGGMRISSIVLQIVVYALVIGIVGFLLYRFAPFLMMKWRQVKREGRGERVILGERISDSDDAVTLFGEAEKLAREGNLRGAVRKGYVALLCELSDRRIIGLARHKTNRDYLRDVRKNLRLHREMNNVTNSFERHWYGFEEVSVEDWEEFRTGYRQAIDSARN